MMNCLLLVPHQKLKGSFGSKKQQNLLAENKAKIQAQDSVEAPLKQARHPSCWPVFHYALPKLLGQHRLQTVDLKELVDQINAPTWTFSDGERIYKALTRLIAAEPTNTAGILWRGILARIMGYDARSDLELVLAKDPKNRLARLNLAILPVTCLEARMEDRNLERYIGIIDSFLKQHPQDYFGQLVKVALNYQKLPLIKKNHRRVGISLSPLSQACLHNSFDGGCISSRLPLPRRFRFCP